MAVNPSPWESKPPAWAARCRNAARDSVAPVDPDLNPGGETSWRLALKLRDGDVSSMSLLLLDSRHNRDFVRAHADVLSERFPISGRRTLELLAAGADPAGCSVILL